MTLFIRLPSIGAIVQRGTLGVFFLIAAGILAPRLACAEPGQNPPRYRLKVGQEIEYSFEPDRDNSNGLAAGMSCLVVGENADKGWKLLFWNSGWLDLSRSRTIGSFDLFADGRVVSGREWTWWGEPEMYFPRLPDGPLTAETTWKSKSLDGCTEFVFRGGPPAAGSATWSFEFRAQEPFVIGPAWTASSEIFDLERGLIGSATLRSEKRERAKKQDEPKTETIGGTLKLVTSQLPEEEARRLVAEAAIFFRAAKEAQSLRDEAPRYFKHRPELLDRVDAVFAKLEGTLTFPLLKEMLDYERRVCQGERTYAVETAEEHDKHLNHPSPDWQTTDLDGNAQALKDYRGKVVLIDFWFRGCLFCIKAMPQMKQLADDFKDQPVAVLGMNSDQDETDARSVIDALGLNFPTLKDQPKAEGPEIHDQYSIHGFPALVLIDQQGVVREIHRGYSLTLRDELAARIRELLAATPAADVAGKP